MTTSKTEFITVVIPTRERCDTLNHTLRTCVMQNYENLEILVSDNASQDETAGVVASFQDPRIRYICTAQCLCMADNWEFALQHVRPYGYVLFIGDDDGLLTNAIQDIAAIIRRTQTSVLRWDLPTFWWPGVEHTNENMLHIPYLDSTIRAVDSEKTMRRVLDYKVGFSALPMLYLHTAVRYDVLSEIMGMSGRFFCSRTPDVYSGFVIAERVKSYLNSRRPFAIGGSSLHSIGAGSLGSEISDASKKYTSEDNVSFHPRMSFCLDRDVVVIESYLQARDHSRFSWSYEPDMVCLIDRVMKHAARRSEVLYAQCKEAMIATGRLNGIETEVDRALQKHPWLKNKAFADHAYDAYSSLCACFKHLCNKVIMLDGRELALDNIYDAALLCSHIFALRDHGLIGDSMVWRSLIQQAARKFRA